MLYRCKLRILVAVLQCAFASTSLQPQNTARRTIHVFVALADNQNQGIVPVPPKLGNGSDAVHNLYWGAAFGVKTFFIRSSDWTLLNCQQNPKAEVLERCVFTHRQADVLLVADAYRGGEIQHAIRDFLNAAAGTNPETVKLPSGSFQVGGGSSLVAYVGHDGLMDFQLPVVRHKKDENHREAIILACASKQFFAEHLRESGAFPLLWTTGLMAPEAYTLKNALDGWIGRESTEQVRERAAEAYDQYQKCGLRGARKLFATGW